MKSPKKSIILVDDHIVVRSGLKELIEMFGSYEVKEQYNNGKELIDALTLRKATADLIIMDVGMPVMDGLQTVEWLHNNSFTVPILMLTLDTSEKTVVQLFRLGVRGYILKNCTAEELQAAINAVMSTGYYHNEFLTKSLLANTTVEKEKEQKETAREQVLTKLTAREHEFLQLVCNEAEYTYEQIAEKMGLNIRTINGYRESLFEKFDIKSKPGLLLFAIKHKLVSI